MESTPYFPVLFNFWVFPFSVVVSTYSSSYFLFSPLSDISSTYSTSLTSTFFLAAFNEISSAEVCIINSSIKSISNSGFSLAYIITSSLKSISKSQSHSLGFISPWISILSTSWLSSLETIGWPKSSKPEPWTSNVSQVDLANFW